MGVVYRASHRMMPGEFALKVIKPDLAADPEVQQRFLQEVTTANALQHPNIIRTYLPFRDGTQFYLPMQLLRGKSLSDLLNVSSAPWDSSRSVECIRQAAAGLGHAHEHASFNSYRHAAKLAVDLGRQSQGWLQSAK